MDSFSREEIEYHVAKICATVPFKRSEKLQGFLRYIIDEYLNNNTNNIKAYSIAVAVFNRPDHFDAQTDNIVRVYAGKLRRSLKDYYQAEGANDTIVISVPKGRYFPLIQHRDSLSKNRNDSTLSSIGQSQEESKIPNPSLAIVMFCSLNKTEMSDHYTIGLTNELMVALTRFSHLHVIGPLIPEDDKALDFRKFYDEYGAKFVLQGWIQIQNSNIKFTISLSDASNSNKIWGKIYKYNLKEVSLFEIEEEITSQVAAILADGLGIIYTKLHNDSYHKYIRLNDVTMAILKYNRAWMTHAPLDWEIAHKAVVFALNRLPDNPLLIALLSNIYYADVLHELNIVPESYLEMEKLAYKAYSLDSDLQVARYNLVVQNAFHGRTQKCIDEARKVVEMNPNHARILSGCAVATTSVGAYDLGLEFIERAKKLNPHYPGWFHFINYLVHFGNGRYEEAWAEAQRIHVEGLFLHPLFRASILGKLGKAKEAEPYIRELLQIKPEFLKRPHKYIRLIFVTDKHVNMIWDGLQQAGIEQFEIYNSKAETVKDN